LVLQELRDLNAEEHHLRHSRMNQKETAFILRRQQLFGSSIAIAQAGIDYWQMSQGHVRREHEVRRQVAVNELMAGGGWRNGRSGET
jgi:hypothetical protein